MPETMIEKLPQHRQIVRGFVMKLVGDAALADDLTQESFVRATRTEKSHRGDASERAWLSAIALNLVRDHFRATKRRPQTISDDGFLDGIESSDDDGETQVIRKEMTDCIAEHLLLLPHPQYDVVALHDMADLPHKEIASQLGISEAISRVLLHRGRAALRKILERNCVLSLGCDDVPCERR